MKVENFNLTIGWLYPDLMSTYGDRGNIICLVKRCQWRGIKIKVKELSLENQGEEIKDCDFLFMGGAQDRQQKIVACDLREEKGLLIKAMIEKGIPGLFICGAYQFMGHYYKAAQGNKIWGLGVFDLYTIHPGIEKPRCIGNTLIKIKNENENEIDDRNSNYLVGFENHGGRTYLGKKVKPLGEVVVGYGNNGEDRTEGCIYKNSIGTYLHGPILPKNPHLADWLIRKALFKKYGFEVKLKELNDSLEWQAHQYIVSRFKCR